MEGQNKTKKPSGIRSDTNTANTANTDTTQKRHRASPTFIPSLIAGEEGSHLTRWFAPSVGTCLSRAEYSEILAQSSGSLTAAPAVYIHLPFCPSRCLSCDRFTTVTHSTQSIDSYLDNLDREMEAHAERVGEGRFLAQLHLGGGTPNYLTEPQLLRLISTVERYFRIAPSTEMSIEASPSRSSESQFQLLRGLGFDSIKFQVRDLDAGVQRAIGRSNSFAVLEDVFRSARDAGIAALGIDLMYGLPEQTVVSIRRTADALIELSPDRISCHAFSKRQGEFLHQSAISGSTLPSLADRLILFNAVIDRLEAAHYQWVGLDSFMRSHDRLAIAQQENRLHRNWIGYNLHGGATVFGFGASAISEVGTACVRNFSGVDDWQAALARDELPVRGGVALSEREQAYRRAISGLLCNMQLESGSALADFGGAAQDLEALQQQGVLRVEKDRIAVTPEGRIMLHHTCGHNTREYAWASDW
jgi:oxygen-independent coproporphyrinogen-3 oxidase